MTASASFPDQIGTQPGIDADAILKALANPVRRDILAWLKTPHAGISRSAPATPSNMGVCAGHIDNRCGLSQSTVSFALAVLCAGLISATKVGQWVFFRRNESVIAAFLRQLNLDM